jgi:hypothetical protein
MKTYISPVFVLGLVLQVSLSLCAFSQEAKITAGATFKTTGGPSIIIKDANFINDGNFIASAGTTVTMKGTAAQSIGGTSSSTFQNLILDNSNGLLLANSETVNGTLTFTNGKITLDDNGLFMGPSATISGSSGSNYVITNGVGSLHQQVMNNATDVTYPVGLTTDYLPVTIKLAVGSTADDLSARVGNGLYTAYNESDVPTGSLISDHAVNKTWYIGEAVAGGSDATVKVQWNAGNENPGFNHAQSDLGHYSGAAWVYSLCSAAGGSGPYTQSLSGLISFSPIGVYSPQINCAADPGPYCEGSPMEVSFIATGGLWTSGNTFTAQLSDATGGFTSPVTIGTLVSQTSGDINASLPGSAADGTGYRVKIVSDNPVVSGEANEEDITIYELRDISGDLTYYNTANTPLLSNVIVRLFQDGEQLGSDYVVTNGSYTFTDLCPGNYELRVTSSKSTAGSVNTTDAAQVNYWGPNPYIIEKVRFYAGDVTGGTFFLNSSDAQLIRAHFVYGTAFAKGEPWTFWKAGQTISYNSIPTESYPAVTMAPGTNTSANIYGLCTGDFNRSFSAQTKQGNARPEVVYDGFIYAGQNMEINMPVRLVYGEEISAISLILDYPSEFLEITGIQMTEAVDGLEWTVTGNELRIGWFNSNPVNLQDNDALLMLNMKTTDAFIPGNIARLSLADDPLNEIADENYTTIGNVQLSLMTIESSVGLPESSLSNQVAFGNFPNPFINLTTFGYSIPARGRVTLEISSMIGESVSVILDEVQAAGYHSFEFKSSEMGPGLYIATLRLAVGNDLVVKTLKIIKEK